MGYAYFIADRWGVDQSLGFWLDHLAAYEKAHAGFPDVARYWSGPREAPQRMPKSPLDTTAESPTRETVHVTTRSGIRGLFDEEDEEDAAR